jgi:hypothetical protein
MIGRPRVEGLRLPTLEQVFQASHTVWQTRPLGWGGEEESCTGTALRSRSGSDPFSLCWVLTRDPSGTRFPQRHRVY